MEKKVGVRQRKNEATRIVREVREQRAEYVITVSGEPAARLVPIPVEQTAEERKERIWKHLEDVDRIAKEVAAAWKSRCPQWRPSGSREGSFESRRRSVIRTVQLRRGPTGGYTGSHMAKTVGVRQLKNEATRIVREVREQRAEYLITVDGKPAARLVPVDASGETPEEREARIQAYMHELDALAKEIGKVWKPGLTAAEAVAEQRR